MGDNREDYCPTCRDTECCGGDPEQLARYRAHIAALEADLARVAKERAEYVSACADSAARAARANEQWRVSCVDKARQVLELRARCDVTTGALQVVSRSLVTLTKAIEDDDTAQVGEAIMWLRHGVTKALATTYPELPAQGEDAARKAGR